MKNFAFALYDIFRTYEMYLTKNLKQFDLGLSDYPVLIHLYYYPDCRSQNELAKALKRDKSLITRVTKNLSKLGYIYIESDGKKKNLYLTEKGYSVAPHIRAVIEFWENSIMLCFNQKEKESFLLMFDRIHNHSANWQDDLNSI